MKNRCNHKPKTEWICNFCGMNCCRICNAFKLPTVDFCINCYKDYLKAKNITTKEQLDKKLESFCEIGKPLYNACVIHLTKLSIPPSPKGNGIIKEGLIINAPVKIKDQQVTNLVLDLTKLPFIEMESKTNGEYIVKKKYIGRFAWLVNFSGTTWVGQILKDKKTGQFYFCNQEGRLADIVKLDTWEQVEQFMQVLKRYAE